MKITITLGNEQIMEAQRIANEHHVPLKTVTDKLKNIYLANITDDLSWIDEMLTEDEQ